MNTLKELQQIIDIIFKNTPTFMTSLDKKDILYQNMNTLIKEYYKKSYKEYKSMFIPGITKQVFFPDINLGNVSAHDCFSLDEFFCFYLYYHNKKKYKYMLDIGANVGLHSIYAAMLGMSVLSIEPSTENFCHLTKNIQTNKLRNVELLQKAFYFEKRPEIEFTYVKNNAMASHITGTKTSYGPTSKEIVPTISFDELNRIPDIIKLDAEGIEGDIIRNIPLKYWKNMDALIEVHSIKNATDIFDYLIGFKDINIFSQKKLWKKVENKNDMPMNNKEGLIFVSPNESIF